MSMQSIRSWVDTPDVSIWWRKEGMELGKVCCLTYQVLYYPGKPYGIRVPWPWPRIKSLIPVERNQVWQVVHGSHRSKGPPRQVYEGFWCCSCLSHTWVWRLPLSVRLHLPSSRKPVLPMVPSKERLSWRNTPGKRMTQFQWHSTNSNTSSRRNPCSWRVRRSQ